MESRLHVDRFDSVMELAANGCKDVYNVLDKEVRANMKELLQKMSL